MGAKIKSLTLLDGVLVNGNSASVAPLGTRMTFQASGFTSAGVGTANVNIQVSNDDTKWTTVDTMALTLGVTEVTDVYAMDAAYKHVRGTVDSLTGTDAEVTLVMGAYVS